MQESNEVFGSDMITRGDRSLTDPTGIEIQNKRRPLCKSSSLGILRNTGKKTCVEDGITLVISSFSSTAEGHS